MSYPDQIVALLQSNGPMQAQDLLSHFPEFYPESASRLQKWQVLLWSATHTKRPRISKNGVLYRLAVDGEAPPTRKKPRQPATKKPGLTHWAPSKPTAGAFLAQPSEGCLLAVSVAQELELEGQRYLLVKIL